MLRSHVLKKRKSPNVGKKALIGANKYDSCKIE